MVENEMMQRRKTRTDVHNVCVFSCFSFVIQQNNTVFFYCPKRIK